MEVSADEAEDDLSDIIEEDDGSLDDLLGEPDATDNSDVVEQSAGESGEAVSDLMQQVAAQLLQQGQNTDSNS